MQVLKLGVPDVAYGVSLREKLQALSSLLIVGCSAGGEVYGETVSQPFLPSQMVFLFVRLFFPLPVMLLLLSQPLGFSQRKLFRM